MSFNKTANGTLCFLFLLTLILFSCGPTVKNYLIFSAPVQRLSEFQHKPIALTFDDGPDPTYTPQVLDILNAYSVKATFFLRGDHLVEHPEIAQRIFTEGHTVGNHSYDHPDYTKLTPDELLQGQIKRAEEIFASLLSLRPRLVRPPFGFITDDQVTLLGENNYQVIKWSVANLPFKISSDYPCDPSNVQFLVNRAVETITSGDIILMHDEGPCTPLTLPSLLQSLQERDFEFVTVPKLLNIPEYF